MNWAGFTARPTLAGGFHAIKKGLFEGFYFSQHPQGNEGWKTAKASGCHFIEYRPHGGDESRET